MTERQFSGTASWKVQRPGKSDVSHQQPVDAVVQLVDGRLNYLVQVGKDEVTNSTKTRRKALPRQYHMIAAIDDLVRTAIKQKHPRGTAINFGRIKLS